MKVKKFRLTGCIIYFLGDPRVKCVPIPKPECVYDQDCGSQLACLGGTCQNPCLVFRPCYPSATCQVMDTLPVRTMVCICPDGYITTADGRCEFGK